MNVVRRASVAIALVLSMVLVSAAVSGAQSGSTKPQASEVGVSASEIHIAVLADVDNAIVPGLFKGAPAGVKGAAEYLNSKAGGGGIAGRKVVVDFIDSKLNPTESRNAVITACSNDFAMVGSAMVFLSSVVDEVGCVDKSGTATGLPDLPSFAVSVAQSCSAVAFPVNPPQLDCATATQSPQTYRGGGGDARYLVKKFGKLHGAYVYGTDTKDAIRGSKALINTNIAAGIKDDQVVGISGRDPQSAYTPVVQKMKQDGSNYGNAIGDTAMINLRSEAQLQGVSSDVVWDCMASCYSKDAAANPVLDNSWLSTLYLPLEEASTNTTMQALLKYVGRDNVDQYAVYAFAATLAFADAAKAAVAKDGVNGLTRKAFLETGIPTLTKFSASGILGERNVASKNPTACFISLHLQGGKYTRTWPKKKGTFDCNPKNAVETQADLIGG